LEISGLYSPLNVDGDVTDGQLVDDRQRRRDIPPTNPIGLMHRLLIRLRYRHITDPARWTLRVRFDEIIESNLWDLSANIDELNERYVAYSDLYRDHMPNRRRSS
jgi:hypothetical protein